MKLQTVNLESLTAQRDVRDSVEGALADVLRNIQDMRTQADASRKLTLTIEFRPDEEKRYEVAVVVGVQTKLAPILALGVEAKLQKDGDGMALKTMQFLQEPLPFEAPVGER